MLPRTARAEAPDWCTNMSCTKLKGERVRRPCPGRALPATRRGSDRSGEVQVVRREDDATLRRKGPAPARDDRGRTLTEVALQLRDDVELLRGLDPSATVSSPRLFARLTTARTIAALPAPAFGWGRGPSTPGHPASGRCPPRRSQATLTPLRSVGDQARGSRRRTQW
jgi:hypothetical protein